MSGRPHLAERAVEALQEKARRIEASPLPPRPPLAAPEPRRNPIPPASASNAPPIALAALEAAGLVVRPRGGARSRLAEEIALVREQVLRGIPNASPGDDRCARVVLVTSVRPGDGKTFISLNLSASIAEGAGVPVLLVDADGRRGSLSDALSIGDQPGLRMLATGSSVSPASLVRPTAIPQLSVLGFGGPAGESSAGELLSEAVRRVATELPNHVIVLDMPPALATSDAGVLAPLAGQVVMVVLAEKTQRNELESALDVLDACPEIRLLLNRAGLTLNNSFGAHGGYDGYGSPGRE